MKNDKQWKGWNELFKNNSDLLGRRKSEQKALKQFKHMPISMTRYYSPSWSGWNDFLSKVDK
ncbi:hypothetical protein LNL84_18375 [Vibrio sp. ZSDZ34]|uniref:Uncharacterized protein n=1 Tax=Vibrio gelatinilyticus TaxID=2893468 RepID=A0A9X1WL06_9VIBR|nr:hypothetical protein [Vibrio gelatinilyticus]MCJ2378779.1 hypothetical protein [Vibrio gelatinilyticus]